MSFELTVDTAPAWVAKHGLNPTNSPLDAAELPGGVSGSVIAVTGPGVAVVVKQALARLRVKDLWEADVDRTESEVAAARVFAELTPRAVPRVLAHDPENHVFAMELVPPEARNWQAEIAQGRVHPDVGSWAGKTLGIWHARTSARADVKTRFERIESFEQLRLAPFHETVIRRRPDLAPAIEPYARELRTLRHCLVHGDFAPKNTLIGARKRRWVLDFEVAHTGNPIFDLGFFLSFVLLSAVRWRELRLELRSLADKFLSGYASAAGQALVENGASLAGHTACLILARTDGSSPAQFLDDDAYRDRARHVGIALLERPTDGLWSWT